MYPNHNFWSAKLDHGLYEFLLHFQCSDWVTQFTEVLLAEFFFTITSSARFHETKKLVQKALHNFIASVVNELKLQRNWMLV